MDDDRRRRCPFPEFLNMAAPCANDRERGLVDLSYRPYGALSIALVSHSSGGHSWLGEYNAQLVATADPLPGCIEGSDNEGRFRCEGPRKVPKLALVIELLDVELFTSIYGPTVTVPPFTF